MNRCTMTDKEEENGSTRCIFLLEKAWLWFISCSRHACCNKQPLMTVFKILDQTGLFPDWADHWLCPVSMETVCDRAARPGRATAIEWVLWCFAFQHFSKADCITKSHRLCKTSADFCISTVKSHDKMPDWQLLQSSRSPDDRKKKRKRRKKAPTSSTENRSKFNFRTSLFFFLTF